MIKLEIEVSEGAGDDFLNTLVQSVNRGEHVYFVVAGEYGYLLVEGISVLEDDR